MSGPIDQATTGSLTPHGWPATTTVWATARQDLAHDGEAAHTYRLDHTRPGSHTVIRFEVRQTQGVTFTLNPLHWDGCWDVHVSGPGTSRRLSPDQDDHDCSDVMEPRHWSMLLDPGTYELALIDHTAGTGTMDVRVPGL